MKFQVSVQSLNERGSNLIPGIQPFICSVVPTKLFSAFTNSNMSTTSGKSFTVSLLGRDRFQNVVNSVVDVILAILSHSDETESPSNSTAPLSGNGVYQAAFLLTKAGLYSITVQINDNAPNRNPYFLICNPEQASNPGSSGLVMFRTGNSTHLMGQDSTAGTTGVWVI